MKARKELTYKSKVAVLRRALKVIYVWASFHNGDLLEPDQVTDVAFKALGRTGPSPSEVRD